MLMANSCFGFGFPTNAKVYWNSKGHLVEFDGNGVYEFFLRLDKGNQQVIDFSYNGEKIALEEMIEIPGFLLGIDEVKEKFIGFAYEANWEVEKGSRKLRLADRTSIYVDKDNKLLAVKVKPNSPHVRRENWNFEVHRQGVNLKDQERNYFLKILGRPISEKRFFTKLAQ